MLEQASRTSRESVVLRMFSMRPSCRTRTIGTALGSVLLVSMSACDDADHSDGSPSPALGQDHKSATLIVWSDNGREETPSDDALVTGALGISTHGCLVLNGVNILVAPPGSSVNAEGTRVSIAGLGEFGMGDTITGRGGYVTAPSEEWEPDPASCLPLAEGGEFAVFSVS
ncbi:MAG: hypothetical protein QM655_14315 [Nocardioidaceae bacterium]